MSFNLVVVVSIATVSGVMYACSEESILVLSSQIAGDRLAPFEEFSEHYHTSNMKGMYKKAVISALKVGLIPVTSMPSFQGSLVSFL